MQKKLTMEFLLELSNAEIIKISNRFNLCRQFWCFEKDIEEARQIYYSTKGKHDIFSKILSELTIIELIERLDEKGTLEVERNSLKQWIISYSNCEFMEDEVFITEDLIVGLWNLFKKVVPHYEPFIAQRVILKYDDIDKVGSVKNYGVAIFPFTPVVESDTQHNDDFYSDYLLEEQPDPIRRLYGLSEKSAYREAVAYCFANSLLIVSVF